MKHSLKWFTSRIGKKIYRNSVKCCSTCEEINKNGLIVMDKQHAEYLELVQHDLDLDYADKR